MGKTAGGIYSEMEKYEDNLAIETLNRIYLDKVINTYRKSKKIIDMHTHTNYSDGDLSPQELIRLAIDKRISKLEKCVKTVEKLMNDLNGSASNVRQMAGILQLRYIQHEDKEVIKDKIRISERTFWRRVKDLIRLAKRYLGDFHL